MSLESDEIILQVDGQVEHPRSFTFTELSEIEEAQQIRDVSRIVASREGDAVRLEGLLQLVKLKPDATFIGLHSEHDDFHASIPLADVRDQALLIYRLDGQPLPRGKGGPTRFYIPDHASCNTAEIDECANVKFLDRIEFTSDKGLDNRPQDEQQHAELHAKESQSS